MDRTLRVEVDLPADALTHHPWEPGRIAREMRTLWLVEQVRERRLGPGKAAELAGTPRAEFELLMGRHGVSVFDFDPEELDVEIATARHLAG